MAQKKGAIHPTRIFKSENDMQLAWDEYKQFLFEDAKNWPKVQYVGKDGQRVEDYPVLPYTLEGFEVYCYKKYGNIGQYFDNKDGYYKEFVAICSRIRREIRAQQITGGMLGMFNPSITQRLNGLVEKQESEIKIKKPPIDTSKLSDNTLDELISAVEKDEETD